MKMVSKNRKQKKSNKNHFFTKYLFEFFIVFFGVYLAFLFTDYQDDLRDKKIRIKYYSALIHEFEVFAKHLIEEETKLLKYLDVVDQIEAGGQPQLISTDLYYLYNGITVRAAFNSKNFEAIDEDLLMSIIGGIYQLEILEKKIESISQLDKSVLLPLMVNGAIYYDESGQLLEYLQWYPKLVREIHHINSLLQTIVIEQALPDLKSKKIAMKNFAYWQLKP